MLYVAPLGKFTIPAGLNVKINRYGKTSPPKKTLCTKEEADLSPYYKNTKYDDDMIFKSYKTRVKSQRYLDMHEEAIELERLEMQKWKDSNVQSSKKRRKHIARNSNESDINSPKKFKQAIQSSHLAESNVDSDLLAPKRIWHSPTSAEGWMSVSFCTFVMEDIDVTDIKKSGREENQILFTKEGVFVMSNDPSIEDYKFIPLANLEKVQPSWKGMYMH